jgi:predicted RNA-binding Zn ribbon-like protein
MSADYTSVHEAEDREGFRFRGGHRAIDLTATLQGRSKAEPRELLGTPDDLERWLEAAGMGPASAATPEDLSTARALREAIYTLASHLNAPQADADEARTALNRIAAGAAAVPVLRDDAGFSLVGDVGMLLVTLAREAVHLLGSAEAAQIRQCQSPVCTIFFVDNSRKGDRRWCSMAACGNKAKVAEFRRRRSPGTGAS